MVTFSCHIEIKWLSPHPPYDEKMFLSPLGFFIPWKHNSQGLTQSRDSYQRRQPEIYLVCLGSSGFLLPPSDSLNAGIALTSWQLYLVLSRWHAVTDTGKFRGLGWSCCPLNNDVSVVGACGCQLCVKSWRGSPALQVLPWTADIPCQSGPGILVLLPLG